MTLLIDHREALTHERLDVPSPSPAVSDNEALLRLNGRAGGIALASDGSIFVSDQTNMTIWHVTPDGAIRRHIPLAQDSFSSTTRLLGPAGLALHPDGGLVVADASHDRIALVERDGAVRVLAGGANGHRDGPGAEAMFRRPQGVAVAADGTCFVADTGNDCIRRISPDGIVTTLAGSTYDYGDGRGAEARFRRPGALALAQDGTLYVADTGNNALRIVSLEGMVSTLAGAPPGGDHDGIAPDIGLQGPSGVAVGPDGELWVADHDNAALRRIGTDGRCETRLRSSGRRWPFAVGVNRDRLLVLLVAAFDDVRSPSALVELLARER